MTDLFAVVVAIGIVAIVIAAVVREQGRRRGAFVQTRSRQPEWFTDWHREERNAHVRSFQEKAAKGLSEESRSRAHLQAVTKAGDSRS